MMKKYFVFSTDLENALAKCFLSIAKIIYMTGQIR